MFLNLSSSKNSLYYITPILFDFLYLYLLVLHTLLKQKTAQFSSVTIKTVATRARKSSRLEKVCLKLCQTVNKGAFIASLIYAFWHTLLSKLLNCFQ